MPPPLVPVPFHEWSEENQKPLLSEHSFTPLIVKVLDGKQHMASRVQSGIRKPPSFLYGKFILTVAQKRLVKTLGPRMGTPASSC